MISVFRRMLSRHPVSDEDLSTLADGRLTPAREAAVLAHVEVCEPCRRKLAELRALKALLAAVPQAAPRRSFALGAEHAYQRRPSVAPKASSRLVFVPAAALSALLLLLAADFALIDNGAGRATDGAASLAADKAAFEAAPAAPQPAAAGRAASDSPAEPSPSPAGGPGLQRDFAAQASPQVPKPTLVPRASPPEAADAAGRGSGGDGVPLIRVLEGLALATLVFSAGYVFMQSRRSGGFS